MAARFRSAVSLVEADPDLFGRLSCTEATGARSRAMAPAAVLRPGEREPWRGIDQHNGHLGLLVLDGLLTRNVTLLGRTSIELVGAGDVLRPWDDDDRAAQPTVPQTVSWTVHLPTRVALLDQHFAERLPGVGTVLVIRGVERAKRLAHHLAILENPHVAVRLLLLFWQLADRWGKVGRDGVIVPLQLTHKTLGRLVRAQRPSVTASLRRLAELGLLVRRRADAAWILQGEPGRQLRVLLNEPERPKGSARRRVRAARSPLLPP